METKQQPAFLVFSDDWGEHPSSCQHIFKHIAKKHPVLWVNTVGMRSPKLTFTDVRKAFLKLRKMLFGADRQQKKTGCRNRNLNVFQPLMIPFPKLPGSRLINRLIVTRGVKKRLAQMGVSEPILVTTVPNACDYVGRCNEARVVYYCVDDFAEWPGLESEIVREMEDTLIAKTDQFIATSEKLFDRLQFPSRPTMLLGHGVDVGFFSNLPMEEHPLVAKIPKPRVGYYGLFDERSDQVLLCAVANKLPSVHFVITGAVETDISCFDGMGNVHFTGPVPYEQLPSVVVGWEACLLPYKINNLTDAISPLKLKEYLATQKPVVSTEMPESRKLSEYLYLGRDEFDWVKIITCLVLKKKCDGVADVQGASRYLKGESWDIKAELFRKAVVGL